MREAQVRLYQSSIFVKEPTHGETAWHTDLGTSPFDTDGMVRRARERERER